MSKRWKTISKILLSIVIVWVLLTVWVNYSGKQQNIWITAEDNSKTALIVFNPDPFYNLDEKVCRSFAAALKYENISSHIVTTKRLDDINDDYDLYVFCTNTYNWGPDWGLTNTIKSWEGLSGKKTVALTVGAGSTMRAQRKLEWHLQDRGADIIASEMFWLMRPNDENQTEASNINIAREKAYTLGRAIAGQIR